MFTKTKILIISLISAVALLVAVAASAVIITYVSPNSDKTFKNTSDRLFSDFSELGEIEELLERTDNAQSLYLFILGDDLGLSSNFQIKSEGIFLNSDKNEGSVSFTLTVGEINLPISVYYNDEKITVQGLNEDNITIPKANIKEELEQSVLAPDSDSQFALDRETFDELVERIDSLINKGDTSEKEEKREKELADLEIAIKNITAHVKNHIDTKSGLSFSKTGFRLVKNNELHFDKDAIAEIFVAIAEESEKNETLRGYLNSVFFTESDGDTDNSEETASIIPLSADTSGTAKGRDALLELAESIKEKFEALDITLAYTTRGNYLEKLDVTVATRTDGDNESAVTLSADFTVTDKNAELVATLRSEAKTDGKTEESEITANYSKVKTAKGFDINLDLTVCDEPDEKECEDETFTFNFSYNEKNGKFNTALESKKFNFELSGVYKFDKENKDLSIKVDKVHRFGEESFTERLLTFTVTKAEATEISVPDGKSLVTMNEHEIFDAFRSLPIYKVEGMVYELIGTSFGFVYTNDYKLIFHPDVTTSLASVCLQKYKEYVKAPETDHKDFEILNTYVYDSVNDVYLLFDYETRNSVKVVSKCPTSGSYHSAYIDEYGNYAVHDIIVEKDTPNSCGSRGYKRGVCKECGKEVVKHKPVIPHEMTSKTYNTTDVSGTQITVTLTYCKNCESTYTYTAGEEGRIIATLTKLSDGTYRLKEYSLRTSKNICVELPGIEEHLTISEIFLTSSHQSEALAVRVPSGVKTIRKSTGDYYVGDYNTQIIILPATIQKIEDGAFNNHSALNTVYFLGTEEQWNSIDLGEYRQLWSNITVVFTDSVTNETIRKNVIDYLTSHNKLSEKRSLAKTEAAVAAFSAIDGVSALYSEKVTHIAYDKANDLLAVCGAYDGQVTKISVLDLGTGATVLTLNVEDSVHRIDIAEGYLAMASKISRNLHIYDMGTDSLSTVELSNERASSNSDGDYLSCVYVDENKVYTAINHQWKSSGDFICYDIAKGSYKTLLDFVTIDDLCVNKDLNRIFYAESDRHYIFNTQTSEEVWYLFHHSIRWKYGETYIYSSDGSFADLDGNTITAPTTVPINVPRKTAQRFHSSSYELIYSVAGSAAVYTRTNYAVGIAAKNAEGEYRSVDGIFAEKAIVTSGGDFVVYTVDGYGVYLVSMEQ